MPEPKMPFGPPAQGLDRRVDGWETRLADLVNFNRRRPHPGGRFFCLNFAREAVFAVTGVTLLPGVELPTAGWISCAKFLNEHGLDDFEELAIAALGQARGKPEDSLPGDLVSWHLSGELHLAVRVGSEAVTTTETGFATIPSKDFRAGRRGWHSAWRIGR